MGANRRRATAVRDETDERRLCGGRTWKRQLRRAGLITGAGLAAAAVAACGGSGSTTVTKTAAPTAAARAQTQTRTVTKSATTTAAAKKKRSGASKKPSGGGSGKVVPGGLTGHVLNDVEHHLDAKGVKYSTAGGNVIIRGDWGVCSTTPAAGQPINGAVVLHLGHFSCGAGSSSSGSSGGSGAKVVPSGLTGHVLNDVEDRLDAQGISYTTAGGTVILRGDWGVCSTTPAVGQPLTGAVVLHVGHFSCGAG